MFSDAHLHLRENPEEAVVSAEENNVVLALTSGINLESSRLAVENAERFDIVYACVGIHPWYAGDYSEEAYRELRELCGLEKVVAVSEIGLDFFGRMGPDWKFVREYYPREVQVNAFRRQIQLAKEVHLPIVFHVRESVEEVLKVLMDEGLPDAGGAVHGFSGDLDLAERLFGLGLYLSFGRRTLEENKGLIEAVKEVPLERILTETDSSEPANVVAVAERIAEVKGLTVEKVGAAATSNLKRLIGL